MSDCILVQPNQAKQFILEVDASHVGVGAVLCQRSSSDHKLQPCTFFSMQLSAAERNYNVRNLKLFAVKLAVEKWTHLLKKAGQPFVVWIDHKNLVYSQSAK